ncbi:MAG: hypothetical protein RI953_3075 [Pseudomonadota bacterium]
MNLPIRLPSNTSNPDCGRKKNTLANRLFTRNRIRGVSFHRGRSGLPGRRPSGDEFAVGISSLNGLKSGFSSSSHWSGPSPEQIRESAPEGFKNSDLRRLMADHGRNELHTLVSESVDHLVQLKQLARSVERFAGEDEPDRKFMGSETDDELSANPIQEMRIEALRVQRLWKLRLELLEMIAMAQDSLRSSGTGLSRKRRPPAGESDPQPK